MISLPWPSSSPRCQQVRTGPDGVHPCACLGGDRRVGSFDITDCTLQTLTSVLMVLVEEVAT